MRLMALVALLGAVACGSGGGGLGPETPSTTCPGVPWLQPVLPQVITSDTYLSAEVGRYTVSEDLYVNGGALCVEPGVTVALGPGRKIVVGRDGAGALIARGWDADGQSNPVRFTSSEAVPHYGDWDTLLFHAQNDTTRSVLDNVVIEYGGAFTQNQRSCVVVFETMLAMRDVELRSCLGSGVWFDGPNARPDVFERIAFHHLGAAALSIDVRQLPWLEGDVTMGEKSNYAEIRGGDLQADALLPAWGVPWRLVGQQGITVENDAVLTLQAGVRLQLDSGLGLTAGSTTPGGLALAGTAEAPVVLTSAQEQPAAGDWDRVLITPKTSRADFRHVLIEYAGQFAHAPDPKAALVVNGPLTALDDLTIRESGGYGLLVQKDAPAIVTTGPLVLEPTAQEAALRLDFGHLPLLANPNLSLPCSGACFVDLDGGTLSSAANLGSLSLVLHVLADVVLGGTGSLTLGPGSILRFAPLTGLTAGFEGSASLRAMGTQAKPVFFTSDRPEADKQPGDWAGLTLGPGVAGADASLQHAVIEYGGGKGGAIAANVAATGCHLSISDSTVRHSAGWGIYVSDGGEVTQDNVTFEGNALGNFKQD
jgi:hypothetical protein